MGSKDTENRLKAKHGAMMNCKSGGKRDSEDVAKFLTSLEQQQLVFKGHRTPAPLSVNNPGHEEEHPAKRHKTNESIARSPVLPIRPSPCVPELSGLRLGSVDTGMENMTLGSMSPEANNDNSVELYTSTKSLKRDPPYDAMVLRLFRDRRNVWVNRPRRDTAINMLFLLEGQGTFCGSFECY